MRVPVARTGEGSEAMLCSRSVFLNGTWHGTHDDVPRYTWPSKSPTAPDPWPGLDFVDGNGGSDTAFLGKGDDTFVWDPGDGSDTVEGQDGTDTMLFNGANVNEKVDLSANGNRLRFFRDAANITMDTAGIEHVDFNALGGADVVTVKAFGLMTRHPVKLEQVPPDLQVLSHPHNPRLLERFHGEVRVARLMREPADLILLQADADTGYGNALNVMRTVEELDFAGAAAVMIELTPNCWPVSSTRSFLRDI